MAVQISIRELIRIEFNGLKIVIADVKRCKPLSIDIQGVFGDSKINKNRNYSSKISVESCRISCDPVKF